MNKANLMIGVCCAGLLVSGPLAAQDTDGDSGGFWGSERPIDELAIELVNPAGSLFSIGNDFVQQPMQGSLPQADDQSNLRYSMQINWPVMLDNGKVLAIRAELPFNLDQPTYLVGDRFDSTEYIEWRIRQDADVIRRDGSFFDIHDHLYDIKVNVVYGGVSDSGFISMYGVAGVLPTSQDGSVERDAWMLGPEVVLGQKTDWGIFGARFNHQWEIASASDALNDYDHQLSSIQVFFAYGLGNGWSLISNPVIEYDWEAASDNKLSLPLGGGVSKLFRWGRIPLKLDLEMQYYVENPESFGPDWSLRLGITPALSDRLR